MEKFLNLTFSSPCAVPPIEVLLQSIQEDANSSFFRLGTSLHFAPTLNPTYTLVSLRDIVNLSPISSSKEYVESEWSPLNTYKWLFLIVSIASRNISNDPDLESGKISFVYRSFSNFIMRPDVITKKWAIPLLSGIFCATVRMIEETGVTPEVGSFDFTVIKSFFSIDYNNIPSISANPIQLTDFTERDVLLYSFPLPSSNINQTNVFNDQKKILNISLLRFLGHFMQKELPVDIDGYRHVIQSFCVRAETVEYAQIVIFLLFNNDEEKAIEFSDTIEYKNVSKFIMKSYNDTGEFSKPIHYNDTVTMINRLKKMAGIARLHPKYFKDFLASHPTTVSALTAILSSDLYFPEVLSAAATLLTIGEIKLSNPSIPLELFIRTENKHLQKELEALLLGQDVVQPILSSLPFVIDFGFRSQPFFEFLGQLIPKIKDPSVLIANLITILKTCRYDCEHIPQIYTLISKYVDVHAQYLEHSVCMCNFQEKQKKSYNVDDCRQFQKYQHNCSATRLKTPMIISSVQLRFSQKKYIMQKLPKTVYVYLSESEINDPNQLLANTVEWRKVCTLRFSSDQNSAKADLKLPLFANSIKFEFVSLYEDNENVRLICPVCRKEITNGSGMCNICGDNVFKCNRCRNINYTNGFICNECGNSNYCQLEFTISAKLWFSYTHITNDTECRAALKKCDELLAAAHNCVSALNSLRNQIEDILSPLNVGDKAVLLSSLYNEKSYTQFQTLSEYVQHVYAIREAVNTFRGKSTTRNKCFNGRKSCFNCRHIFIQNCINFIVKSAEYDSVNQSVSIPEILSEFLQSDIFANTAVTSLITYLKLRPESIDFFINKINKELPEISAQSVRLMVEIQSIDDSHKYTRLRKLFSMVSSFSKYDDISFTNTIKPLIMSLLTSPLICSSINNFLLINGYNSFNPKKKIELITPDDLKLSEDVVRFYLIDCNSLSIRSSFAEFFINAAKQSVADYERAFQFVFSRAVSIEEYSERYDQVYSVLFHLLKYKPSRVRQIMFSSFFDRLVDFFAEEVIEKKSSMLCAIPKIRSRSPLLQFAGFLEFVLNDSATFFYVLHRKTNIITKLIDTLHEVKSNFIAQTEPIKRALIVLRETVVKAISPYVYFVEPTSTNYPADYVINRKRKELTDYANSLFENIDEYSKSAFGAKKGISVVRNDNTKVFPFDTLLKDAIEVPEGSFVNVGGYIVAKQLKLIDVWLRLWVPLKGSAKLELSVVDKVGDLVEFNEF